MNMNKKNPFNEMRKYAQQSTINQTNSHNLNNTNHFQDFNSYQNNNSSSKTTDFSLPMSNIVCRNENDSPNPDVKLKHSMSIVIAKREQKIKKEKNCAYIF